MEQEVEDEGRGAAAKWRCTRMLFGAHSLLHASNAHALSVTQQEESTQLCDTVAV